MPETRFRKGDLVTFRVGITDVQGEIKEDRGPIGVKGRRLYLIEFPWDIDPVMIRQVELPAEEFQLKRKAGSTK